MTDSVEQSAFRPISALGVDQGFLQFIGSLVDPQFERFCVRLRFRIQTGILNSNSHAAPKCFQQRQILFTKSPLGPENNRKRTANLASRPNRGDRDSLNSGDLLRKRLKVRGKRLCVSNHMAFQCCLATQAVIDRKVAIFFILADVIAAMRQEIEKTDIRIHQMDIGGVGIEYLANFC